MHSDQCRSLDRCHRKIGPPFSVVKAQQFIKRGTGCFRMFVHLWEGSMHISLSEYTFYILCRTPYLPVFSTSSRPMQAA